jgi:hypothetical protein
MTRPLRIEFKGAVYHITSRRNTIQTIFLDIKKIGVEEENWYCKT